ncbi:FHA domain-containing protein [Actinomycetospora lemnae]|uniref:FHA domain-containing protein n=1 Tax=Actinomycetospora lemnae TaxID=3019891 RepID=A0ABT5T245_9PSEU|nr:hypothetical protein [Actinomycetospora sp. DW7H6]MDD7969079.1 hypothetical protein [Actinomycetospora sp. DW7H6]
MTRPAAGPSRSGTPRAPGPPRLPVGGLAVLDVRTETTQSVPWGERITIGRGDASGRGPSRAAGAPRHVVVPDDRVSRLAAEIEVRDDAYLIINRQRHGGLLTLFVPGIAGKDRIRAGNGLLVRDDRSSLGLWLPDGQELTLALLRFAPAAGAGISTSGGLAGGRTIDTSLPTAETWWSVLVAACGPTLIAAATAGPSSSAPRDVHGDAEQIADWHRAEGRPAPSPKTQSEAFRHAQRWLRGVRLNDKTRGWRIAVVEQAIHLRLVTLDDVRLLFPSQAPRAVR